MATLSANISREVPTVGFIAHLDTSPDMSGRHVYGANNPGCTLPLGQLAGSGVYAVRLSNEQRTATVKVLVM